MKKINEEGKTYGRLTVIKEHGRSSNYKVMWKCVCKCKNITIVTGTNLRSGITKSCGCYSKERTSQRFTKHRMSKHPVYNTWGQMISRCLNPKNNRFKYYGGRGIKICKRWMVAKNFIKDMLPTWKEGLSIDRINNDGDYKPSNCRWATPKQQAINQRRIRPIKNSLGEVYFTQKEAVKALGINASSISQALKGKYKSAGKTKDGTKIKWYYA